MLVLDKVFIHTVKTKTSYMPELYVNNMGDIKSETFNNIACRIWTFWIENTTVNMPGQKNIEAD